MNTNWKFLLAILALAFLLSVAIAHAENNTTNGSFAVILNGPGAPFEHPPHIAQGEHVYINDTLDISGVSGWPGADDEYRLAYYGRWTDAPSPGDLDPSYILVLPGKKISRSSSSQYWFWIDPAIFADKTGYWYQFVSNTSASRGEGAGNLRAFYVVSDYRNVFNTTSNQSEIWYTNGTYNETIPTPAPFMPERHIADYVIARGDRLIYSGTEDHRLWLFGRVDGLYGITGNEITKDQIQELEEGSYTLVVQTPGNNTIYEATCGPSAINWSEVPTQPKDRSCGVLLPGLYGKEPVDIRGMAPAVVLAKLRQMLVGTDDVLTTYKVEVADPYVTLDRADEVWVKGRTYLDVRGYSNVANDTPISVVLDNGKTYQKYIELRTITVGAVRTSPGNLSYYRANVPFDYETMAANAFNHTLTVTTALGGTVERGFKVSIMPPDSFRPNATLKYIENFNPFQENMTRVTVTVTIPIRIIETQIIHDTPSQAQLDEAQQKALGKLVSDALIAVLMLLVGLGGGFLVMRFLYRAYKKRKWFVK